MCGSGPWTCSGSAWQLQSPPQPCPQPISQARGPGSWDGSFWYLFHCMVRIVPTSPNCSSWSPLPVELPLRSLLGGPPAPPVPRMIDCPDVVCTGDMGQRPETQRPRDTERERESWRKTGKEKDGECEGNGGREKRQGDKDQQIQTKRGRWTE